MTHIEINVGTNKYIVPLAGLYLTGEKSSRINLAGVGGFDVTDEEYQRVKEILLREELFFLPKDNEKAPTRIK
jgi:hypothetical protein